MKRKFDTYSAAKKVLSGSAMLLALIAAPGTLHAQTALFGTPSNFDVYNDTGQTTYGFEIELDGITPDQLGPAYGFRYGAPVKLAVPNGTVYRFSGQYLNGAWSVSTVIPATFAPTLGHSCTGGIPGCDHFGYYVPYNLKPTNTIYRWLVDDPANPGTLIPAPNNGVLVPAVTVGVQADGIVVFNLPVPPPKQALQFGVAKWVKVLKSEAQRNVAVPELLEDNPVVPNDGDPAAVELAWKLLQFNPHSANSGVLHSQGALGIGAKAVIRKYEFYKFSGKYDPIDHKAICGGDGLCNTPLAGELGDFIGNQMVAANVGVSSVTVARTGTGSGTVTGASGKINCGGSCSAPLALGTSVTLTAKASSNATFTGWTGDCIGTGASCTFSITAENNVAANFDLAAGGGGGGGGGVSAFKISISKNGNGSVTTSPATATFAAGSVVTLTATPGAGQPWIGWGGDCAGTAVTCTLTMDANKSVTANFR